MKLMCHKCAGNNRYNIRKVMSYKKLLCIHCGHYINLNALLTIFMFIFLAIVIFGPIRLYNDYRLAILTDYYYGPGIIEEPSTLLALLIAVLFSLILLFISYPLVAFLTCFINNCIARIKLSISKHKT